MDTKELITQLQPFIEACEKANMPLKKVRLEENVPGVPGAYYHLLVQADWLDPVYGCDDLLDRLVDILISTVDPKIRSYVQHIKVLDKYESNLCYEELIVYNKQAGNV